MIAYVVTAITLIGTIANAYGKRWSFYVWLFTNGYWALHNLINGDIAQAIVFIVNAVVCVIGLKKWRGKDE